MKRSSSAGPVRDLSRAGVAITIDGQALPVAVALQVDRVSVDEDAGLPSMFSIEVAGGPQDETAWIDGGPFAVGAALEIRMGYGGALEPVIAGEITGLEPAFERGSRPSLTVRGHDRRHRLVRGRKTRSFLQQKDSDIASAIASEAGLTAQAEDSRVVHEYVLQVNQTNLQFLQERASRIQYEIVVEDRTLHFRHVQSDQGPVLTLTPEDDLVEFYPRLTTLGQLSALEVRGWSAKDKKEIAARARAGDEGASMGGKDGGPTLAERAFGAAEALLYDIPAFAQAEADELARARFTRAALDLVSGDGACVGRADVRPGRVIRIDGIGTRFSGQYYVSATRHRYSRGGAYRTHFFVHRNAA